MVFSLLLQSPIIFFVFILSVFFALSVHEYGHALSAHLLGDPTAKHLGRLTLNPLAHIDPLGFLMFLLVGFGWGKPVPFNPFNLKDQKKDSAIIALSGPLANLVSVIIFGLILKFVGSAVGQTNLLVYFLSWLVLVNASLMVFNLIPIPPLDGSKVLYAFIPAGREDIIYKLERNGPIILILFIILDRFLPFSILGYLFTAIFNVISNIFGVVM